MPYAKSAGDRKGAVEKPGRIRKAPRPSQAMIAVYNRAFALISPVSRAERWRSSIAAKVPGYLENVVWGKTNVPKGLPNRIRDIVRRCFVQACLEFNIAELPSQQADWYPAAVITAREHMK